MAEVYFIITVKKKKLHMVVWSFQELTSGHRKHDSIYLDDKTDNYNNNLIP